MTVIAMSGQELDRMQVLQDLCAKRITASEAAALIRLTRRQAFRLARRYREDGPAALVSRQRPRPAPTRVTLLTGAQSDFSIGQRQRGTLTCAGWPRGLCRHDL